jgi:hypothetical protein
MAQQNEEPKDKRARVPLDPSVRERVQAEAKKNGRSFGREAAILVKRGLRERDKEAKL